MSEITHSGFYQDSLGQSFLVTQGLSGYTLVDKKKILFRLYLDPSIIGRVKSVLVRIIYRGDDIPPTEIMIPSAELLVENSIPNGPSIGIIFQGNLFPSASIRYLLEFYVIDDSGTLASLKTPELKFQNSGNVRVLVKSLFGTAPWGNKIEPNIGWFFEIGESLNRLASMLPVSDGVTIQSNPDPDIGLGWLGGQAFDTWPNLCPSGNPPSIPDTRFPNVLRCPGGEINNALVSEAKDLRSQGIRVDVTVAWRPRDHAKFPPPGGEGTGGQGMTVNGERLATVVGGQINNVYFTASIMAQEVGHTFGLEPINSPHYDGGAHSKDPLLIDPFAFDFVRLKPYSPPPPGSSFLGDVMSWAWNQGMNSTLYNAFDWEHLRSELVQVAALTSQEVKDRGGEKELLELVQRPFAKLEKIQVENPESALYSKPGSEWYWTRLGFQLLESKVKTNRPGTASSAAGLFSTLRDLGIKEIYAPVDKKPLTIITSTITPVTCYNNGIRSSGLP